MEKFHITPQSKISALLEAYPKLEDKLIQIAPVFKKLKNPFLRKTIAKVTSLQQAAAVGQIPVSELVNAMRAAVGQEQKEEQISIERKSPNQPVWFSQSRIKKSLDARPIIESGGHPLDVVFRETAALANGEIYELITPFLPAPLIDRIEAKGFEVWTDEKPGSIFKTYFLKR